MKQPVVVKPLDLVVRVSASKDSRPSPKIQQASRHTPRALLSRRFLYAILV
jgi:hypothetical protein